MRGATVRCLTVLACAVSLACGARAQEVPGAVYPSMRHERTDSKLRMGQECSARTLLEAQAQAERQSEPGQPQEQASKSVQTHDDFRPAPARPPRNPIRR